MELHEIYKRSYDRNLALAANTNDIKSLESAMDAAFKKVEEYRAKIDAIEIELKKRKQANSFPRV